MKAVSPVGNLLATAGLGMARLLGALVPTSWLVNFGRVMVIPVVYSVPRVRRALLDNAAHILGPDSSLAARRTLAFGVLRSFSRFAMEVLTSHKRLPTDEELFDTMRGKEHYDRANEAGRGIIGVTLHMGNYEVGPLLLTRLHQPVAIVYNRDPVGTFEQMRSELRRKHSIVEIPVDGSAFFGVDALAVLKQKGMVLLAADTGFEASSGGALYPFLDGQAPFLNWPARLALASKAPILPCVVVRDENDRYRLEIDPPIFPDEGSPDEGDGVDGMMARLLRVFERYVVRYPDQWLIIHRYWAKESGPARGPERGDETA